MKLIRPDEIDWLLEGEPRPAQQEALARSYYGAAWRNTKDEPMPDGPLFITGPQARVGWAHFMQMRVGKTPTLLNEFMHFRRDHGIGRLLVVSPNRYKYGWEKDIRFFIPNAPVLVYDSRKVKSQVTPFLAKVDRGVMVINYEALSTVSGQKAVSEWLSKPCVLGFDESVKLKNHASRVTGLGLRMNSAAHIIRILTGLPNPQSPADFYSQLRIIRELDGVNYYAFRGKYCEMGGFRGKKIVGPKNEDQLNALLDLTSFRAKRRDWGTQIDSDFEQVNIEMAPAQKAAYAEMDRDMLAWIDEQEFISVGAIITKNLKLQQISSGFVIDEDKKVRELVPFKKTPKFMDLLDRVTEEVPGKTLVIAHFTHTVHSLYEALREAGMEPAMIGGGKTMKEYELDSEAEKLRFNSDDNCRVLVAQADAVKYGHTLMGTDGQRCHDLCFFENSYNLDTRAQCEERPQGEGQREAIHIWDYFSSKLEEDIIDALQRKQELANIFLDHYGITKEVAE